MIRLPDRTQEMEVTVPSMELFKEEVLFWRKRFREADASGDAVGRRVAEEISRSLRDVALGRTAIAYMIAGMMPMNRPAVGLWYAQSTSLMAYSRMWREVSEPSRFNFGFMGANVCLDYDAMEPRSGGLHFKEAQLSESGLEWPTAEHEVDWYEGESIYLHVSRPAQPTQAFLTSYESFYDTPFAPEEFAAAAPHLKTVVWSTE